MWSGRKRPITRRHHAQTASEEGGKWFNMGEASIHSAFKPNGRVCEIVPRCMTIITQRRYADMQATERMKERERESMYDNVVRSLNQSVR